MSEQVPSPRPSSGHGQIGGVPPRLVVALALVAAGAAVLVAVLLTLATMPADLTVLGAELDVFERVRMATQFVDPPLLALVPLAVLLARLVEPGAAGPNSAATRTVLAGASAVGAALAFFVVLRLVADLGSEVVAPSRWGALAHDLGAMAVAVAGAYWAAAELARTPPADDGGAAPPPLDPPGFPSGPPVAPQGPPPGPPPGR